MNDRDDRDDPWLRTGTILHADLDSFYASVEQRDDPSLLGRPVIVGGGVVLAASYEAKARGVRTAMGGGQARRLCPQARVVPPRFEAYVAASKAVFAVFRDTTPVVEPVSIDEAFLDVGGLRRIRQSPVAVAHDLRARVRTEVGLPITVGVARTKYLAKVASAVGKPDGLLVVPLDGELAFLHALPVERLWGVGGATSARLRAARVRTVADLARLSVEEVVALVGAAAGHHLHALAHGHDPRRVRTEHRRRSMGAQSALGRRPRPFAEVDARLLALVVKVTGRLRAAGLSAATVTVRLRHDDFSRSTVSHTMPQPSAHTEVVARVARTLLAARRAELERRGITLVGVTLSGLGSGSVQLALPLEAGGALSGDDLDGAVDRVRRRFGSGSLRRAVNLRTPDHGAVV